LLLVGVDVGGTFTDGVVYDGDSHRLQYAKAPSTPDDPTQGVLDVLEGLVPDIKNIDRLVHGLTIGTNAILEGKGADVWMLTTRGFRDVLEIARTNRPILYDIKSLKPQALVPRTRTFEINERMLFDGSVRKAFDPIEARAIVEKLVAENANSVAICFLHSYANPAHEQLAENLVRELLPTAFVCSSAAVLSQFREYERFNTTALNAYIGPIMSDYLENLRDRLGKKGYKQPIFVMASNGGVSNLDLVKQLPVMTVLSGPAGGVAAAVELGKRVNIRDLITCDMGGTSTDVCLIEDLETPVTHEQFIGDYANRTPQIEINAVGAGGGSIAWLDAGDILMVGPQSAGADPGPACYGFGGSSPTVTDANLALNRLGPETALGGKITMDKDLAIAGIRLILERLPSLDEYSLADGIIQIAVARMVSAIKEISISRGFDPRDFTLVAYGGAGPMHAAFIADELEIPRILIPLGPGNFAAFGSLISDNRRDYSLTRTVCPRDSSIADILSTFTELEDRGRKEFEDYGVGLDQTTTRRWAGMRYLGQSWELEVPISESIDSIEAIEEVFYQLHERRFGHKTTDITEIVNFRIAVIAGGDKPDLLPWVNDRSVTTEKQPFRSVYFNDKFIDVPVYRRDELLAMTETTGPAVIEENGSTTIIPPSWRFRMLKFGELLLEKLDS